MTILFRRPLGAVLLAAIFASSRPCGAQASEESRATANVEVLDQRMRAFLESVRHGGADTAAAYFPSSGDWSYVHTSHRDDGDRVGVWRFPSAQAQQAIRRGPLRKVFSIDYHGQQIGLFAHQVMNRGTEWRRVRGNRYVPPGASASSPVFVEWRREGDAWVVSSFGDESFPNGRLPEWCC